MLCMYVWNGMECNVMYFMYAMYVCMYVCMYVWNGMEWSVM